MTQSDTISTNPLGDGLVSMLFVSGPVMLFKWRQAPGWPIEYVSPNVAILLGYSAEEFLTGAVAYSDLIPAEDLPRVAAEITQARDSTAQILEHSPYRLRRRDGRFIWVLDHSSILRDEIGTVTHYLGYLVDITSRQEAETRLRLTASVFEHTHEGILITDANGNIIEVNHTFTVLTGYSREEAIGRNPRFLRSGHHGPEFYAGMWRALNSEGSWTGEIWNRRKSGEVYAEMSSISAVRDQAGRITHYVNIFSDITPLKEGQRRLEQMAYYDALTQLPNRVLLADRLQQAIARTNRGGGLLAVGYLDLDGFKPVNDRFGHAAGDRLLVEVARRLTNNLRGEDTLARLGGDEFVVLLTGLGNLADCQRTLARILEMLATPFAIAGAEVTVSASLGVTVYPHDPADADTLIRHADQAMYAAKEAGRNCYRLFDPEQVSKPLGTGQYSHHAKHA